jgi:hypothetical protein
LEEDMRNRDPYRLRNPRERELAVEAGQVVCPRRGIVDIEICFQCSRFGGLQDGATERLVCTFGSVPGDPDFDWRMDTPPH